MISSYFVISCSIWIECLWTHPAVVLVDDLHMRPAKTNKGRFVNPTYQGRFFNWRLPALKVVWPQDCCLHPSQWKGLLAFFFTCLLCICVLNLTTILARVLQRTNLLILYQVTFQTYHEPNISNYQKKIWKSEEKPIKH